MTKNEAIAILEKGRLAEIHDAIRVEERHRMHSQKDTTLSRNSAYGRWLAEIPEQILPEDKFSTFKSLITTPLPTVEVVDDAYTELERIFDGQNRVEEFYFENDELSQDFYEYRKRLAEPIYWQTHGWELFRNHINCVIAIDLPEVQVTDRPEPYFFPVYTEQIYTIVNNIHGDCLFFAYYIDRPEGSDLSLAVYDTEYYRVIHRRQNKWDVEQEVFHGLGHTPARQFYNSQMDSSLFLRANPVTGSLGNLDWLLFTMVSKRHLELYAGFPVVSVYEQECTYETEDGIKCEDGYLHYEQEYSGQTKIVSKLCPKCKGKQLVGPGTVMVAPAPREAGDPQNIPGVIMTEGDVDSLKQMNSEIERQSKMFLYNTIGYGGEPKNETAKNEKQIESNFESRLNVLNNVKKNFEIIQKFTLHTLAQLRYGDSYTGCTLSYGTKFHLQSEQEIQQNYAQAKQNGMPVSELAAQRRALITKKYSNNPDMLKRMLIMEEIEPYPDYSVGELMNMPFVNLDKLFLKINLNDYVQRFERIYGDIVVFMSGIDFNVKIEYITKLFEKWQTEEQSTMKQIQQSDPQATD